MRISYPKELNLKCPVCGNDVNYRYANNGKIVHTLNGDINQEIKKKTQNSSLKYNQFKINSV